MNEPTAKRRFLRRRFVVFGSVMIVAAIAYHEFWMRRPVGEGPAGPSVDRSAFDSVWSDRPVRLIGIGDSITRGFGAKNQSHSYFERLVKNPDDEFEQLRGCCLKSVLPALQTKNIAISGSTSLEHVDHIAQRLEPFSESEYGIVVLTTGGNDIVHQYGRMPPREGAMYGATFDEAQPWIENFETRLEGMLDSIRNLFPGGCEIYLADIYDPTDGVGDAPSVFLPEWKDGLAIHTAYNEVIRKTCQQNADVFLVPLHATFLGHGSHCRQFWRSTYDFADPHYWYFDNIEDPNDRGYDAIRRIFLNAICQNSRLASDK